jgi:lysozyme
LLPEIFPSPASRPGDRRKAATLLVLLFCVALFVSERFRFWVGSLLTYPVHYREYKEFGIRIPGSYSVHGIDVSRWQSRVDWARVKKMKVGDVKVSFAFIKATEGTWMKDPQFEFNWENARKQGITRGAYHFFLPNVNPKDQAALFFKHVRLRSGDLPPVVDVEEPRGMSVSQVRQYTKKFLELLENNYKVKPILYTNKDFYKRYFQGREEFSGYILWIAHYHVASLDMPGEEDWHFWQHSDRGNINGINEKVDFNVFNGDSVDLKKLCVP